MEKTHTEILKDCLDELRELRLKADEIEKRIASLQDQADEAVDFTEVDLEEDFPDQAALRQAQSPLPEPVEAPVPEVPEPVEGPAAEPVPEPVEGPVEGPRPFNWWTDKPGLPVKNIRSGISLYDRALFVKTLFKENVPLYEDTLRELNEAASLEAAYENLCAKFPDWDFSSAPVHNFMMAIRKKIG